MYCILRKKSTEEKHNTSRWPQTNPLKARRDKKSHMNSPSVPFNEKLSAGHFHGDVVKEVSFSLEGEYLRSRGEAYSQTVYQESNV